MQVYEPILHRFESCQRKNNVLIYDSQRYIGKSSEWFFARKNSSTRNETYRCVHCRATRQKNWRTNSKTESNPGARIIVRENFFTISPDYPLGSHICGFETNENCNTHAVWGRRALVRANTELRIVPEKPKLKFAQLLKSIENGKDEFSHLSKVTRALIVQNLTAKNGFDSRRRSFARNNLFGFKKMQENSFYLLNKPRLQLPEFSETKLQNNQIKIVADNQTMACGMPYCKNRFINETDRANHRSTCHTEMLFLDTYEEYEKYKGILTCDDEVIITDNGEIVDINKCDSNDLYGEITNLDYIECDEISLHNVECEVICSSTDTEKTEMYTNNVSRENLTNSFYTERINIMLKELEICSKKIINNPTQCEIFENKLQNFLNDCQQNIIYQSSTTTQPFFQNNKKKK